MAIRQIIHIDEDACTGCGECIPGCPEGALALVDGKAKMVSEVFCDGLGACIGNCPVDAITVETREADDYDEVQVLANIAKQGPELVAAHLDHLREHGETELLAIAEGYLAEHPLPTPQPSAPAPSACGCPGSLPRSLPVLSSTPGPGLAGSGSSSQLRQWPVQIMLVPTRAPYLDGADLLLAADCTPFAYANFHADFVKDKVVLVGCPKLDDGEHYIDKLATIFASNAIRSIEVVRMEVPCCYGLVRIVADALARAQVDVPTLATEITVSGERRPSTKITASKSPSLEDRHGQVGLGR